MSSVVTSALALIIARLFARRHVTYVNAISSGLGVGRERERERESARLWPRAMGLGRSSRHIAAAVGYDITDCKVSKQLAYKNSMVLLLKWR